RIVEQLAQTIGASFDLKRTPALHPTARPDDRVAGTDEDIRLRVDRTSAFAQLPGEAIVQTVESGLAGFVEPKIVREEAKGPERRHAHQMISHPTHPPHDASSERARQAVGQQEVEVFLLQERTDSSSYRHRNVSPCEDTGLATWIPYFSLAVSLA